MSKRSVPLNTYRIAPRNGYEVASVCKTLQILCSFTVQQSHWSVSELSRFLRMPKSTTHNLLRTLERFDFVRQGPEDKHYRLGCKIYELGGLFSHTRELTEEALPHLRRLAEQTGETVKLGLLSGGRVLIVAAVESSYELHTRGDNGRSWWLHSSALGKAILASLPPMEVEAIVDRHGLPRMTDSTITDRENLRRAISQIKSQGYAIDWQESEQGVSCAAVPVPVPASVAPASLSVSGPSIRLTLQKLRNWVPRLTEVARAIGQTAAAHAQSNMVGSSSERQ
jgi:IclR family transcriptional regulator, KDG regulon repressor